MMLPEPASSTVILALAFACTWRETIDSLIVSAIRWIEAGRRPNAWKSSTSGTFLLPTFVP
jgi:hypothetical protein